MINDEQVANLNTAIQEDDVSTLERLVIDIQPADLAEFMRDQTTQVCLKLLAHLPLEESADIFGHLDAVTQCELAAEMTEKDLSQLFVHMNSDERADLFNELSEEQRQGILRLLAKEEREDIRRLASYEEGTTGSVMSSDYVTVVAETSIAQALEVVRHTAPNAETIYQIYILNAEQQLSGVLSLRQLILAKPEAIVDQVMTTDLVSINAAEPQEEASRLISRYDLLALPVVDDNQRLIGIVTYDDAMDVAEAEATEDMHKGASIGPSDEAFGQATIRNLYSRRVNWLVLLVFANILSGAGIAFYEEMIETYVVLVFFLPLLVASGGNAGSQAATLMIRGLATGDIYIKDWGRLLVRELIVASFLGLTMAVAIVGIGFWRGGIEIAQVVGYSMFAIVVVGSLIGLVLPFLLVKVGWDPATASGPLVTSIADIVGVLIYFAIATSVLAL